MHIAFPLFNSFMSPLAVPLLYLDPGSGSFILQLLIAALVGGLLLVKIYFNKIKEFTRRVFNHSKASKDDEQQ